jgi:hypothetical protein
VGRSVKRTYRRRGKNKLVERAAHTCQPTLEGVASRGLLVLLVVVTRLEGSRPREVGEVKDPGITILGILRLGRARALPGLLYLWGGGPRRALRSIALLWRHQGLARRRCHLIYRGGGMKRQ